VILEASAQVFTSLGYVRTTTNRIAERAGISIGSLYQYFPNKDAILVALLERHMATGPEILSGKVNSNMTLKEIIAVAIETAIEVNERDPELHRILDEDVLYPPHIQKIIRSNEKLYSKIIEENMTAEYPDKYENPGLSSELVVYVIKMACHWLIMERCNEFDKGAFIIELNRMICSYLGLDG
jgi:hypothetical protein